MLKLFLVFNDFMVTLQALDDFCGGVVGEILLQTNPDTEIELLNVKSEWQ